MLTIKLITEQTERVIKGLEKKHFGNAAETIEQVIALDKKRRAAQTTLDKNLAEAKQLAARIGALMKEGKREEAEAVKAEVAALKATNAALEEEMKTAAEVAEPSGDDVDFERKTAKTCGPNARERIAPPTADVEE